MASTDEPTTTDTTTAASSSDAPADSPAPPRTPRRRATKASAAAPDATADAGAPGDTAPVAKKAGKAGTKARKKADEAPAKTPRRRRAAVEETPLPDSPTVQAVVGALEDDVVDEAEAITQAAAIVDDLPLGVSLVLLDAATLDDAATDLTGDEEDDEVDEDGQGDDAAPAQEAQGASPAVSYPSFGLLFQAPEPTVAPRRRRATAPAQTPTGHPADAHDATETTVVDEPDLDQADQGPDSEDTSAPEVESVRARRRRGGRGRRPRAGDEPNDAERTEEGPAPHAGPDAEDDGDDAGSSRRRRRRRRSGTGNGESDDPPGTVTKVREPRPQRDEPTAVKGSTRLEAKKQRRREGRESGRRRTIITEAEFLARRESVDRVMVVRGLPDRTQIGVLEDDVLVEHYVSRETTTSMAGNVYLGRVQNVLPSMEAAFVDIGKGRNAVLYAGEVNWDAAGLEGGRAKRIENALSSGDTVLVQVTKDPIGHKGARLTSQISLPGRFLVYVPEGSMTGISRKLPDTERARLKAILKEIVPDSAGVIVRTAAEGASEEELRADVERLTATWDKIQDKAKAVSAKKAGSGGAPRLLHGEPDLTVRVIRDIFTEDFSSLVVSGEQAWTEVSSYVEDVAPDLAQRLTRWTSEDDVFAHHRIDEQLAKALDRKVWLPSGGSLVIDRTEAMTVVDVNTGRFVGAGGNLEETVTMNNIEAAEEIVRQLRLRDIGGIIVIDFIDMVLESNRDLVVRRLLECLGRDRTKHQVAEVTSLGLVQMTRKRVGSGLLEVFSEACSCCGGRGIVIHTEPVVSGAVADSGANAAEPSGSSAGSRSSRRGARAERARPEPARTEPEAKRPSAGPTAAQIAAAAHAAALKHTVVDDEHATMPVTGVEVDLSSLGFEEAVADAVAEGDAVADNAVVENDALTAVETAAFETAALEAPGREATETDIATTAERTVDVQDADEVVSALAPEPEADHDPEPAPRARRKRGRVVAPAGPPRHSTDPETTD